MRVLGVDPGLTRCGVGIIDGDIGAPISLVGVGVILTSADLPLERRLMQLEKELLVWIDFSQLNVRTVMGTGQAAGIALLTAAKCGIPIFMHTPSEVKASVTGTGRANKAQVAEMVRRILSLETIPKPVDATDALALAICHLWRGRGNARINDALLQEQLRLKQLRTR
jgi:crossover junction endodeoxyribonuclease RuvC